MKKILTSLTLLFIGILFSSSIQGQDHKTKTDSITITGRIYDRLTTRDIIDTNIEILLPDSSVINAGKGGEKYWKWNDFDRTHFRDSTSVYYINIPKVEGKYIIKVSKEGYETHYQPLTLSNLKKREIRHEAPKVYLSRQATKSLGEITVKASKVKFYNKGDTIVYNADAFMLPEGSMLDALIAQMPGVEIREGGKIYVNGRFVESLLLNGKDFFKGNKDVMLENIGAYAVKDVAVYEKKDDMTEVLGNRGDVSREYVMDVRLKKDYMAGNMINAEAGGGTSERYIGRLFAMHYTNNSRVAVYGNSNNINRVNRLTRDRYESIENSGNGITRKINGGIDYFADNKLHTWEVTGNVDANYTDRHNTTVTNAVNYLQTADTYEFSDRYNRARDFKLSTYHDFKYKQDGWNLRIQPKFSYNKNRDNNDETAASFNKELQGLDKSIIESIYSDDHRELREFLINRNLKKHESNGHGWDSQLNAEARVKVPGSSDAMAFKVQSKYSCSSMFDDNLQDICYGAGPEASLLQQRFSNQRPHYNFNIQGLARYYFKIPVGNLNASYEFAHTQTRKNSDVSLLEAIAENSMAEFDPMNIPTPDLANSYTSKLYKNEHRIKVMYDFYKEYKGKGTLRVNIEPNFIIESQQLYYHRGETDANPNRSYLKFNIPQALINWKGKRYNTRLTYRLTQQAVNLVNLVDIRNTTDPLNIREGNPDLRNSTNHSINAIYFYMKRDNFSNNIGFTAQWTANDIVNGFRYDSRSGTRTTKAYNVSGNNMFELRNIIEVRFGSPKNFRVFNYLAGTLQNYANMIGYDTEPTKQAVREYRLNEQVGLEYHREKKFQVGIYANGIFNDSRSEGPLLTKNNSGAYRFSFNGQVFLPLDFILSSEFYAQRRFGYIIDSMNSTDFIWNAELSVPIDNRKWIISLEANDILKQRKGFDYAVSATGRTQRVSTILPRYLMLIVHYRFDFKPKRAAQ